MRMARRESRASRRRLALYVASMAMGIASLVALGSFRAGVESALRDQSRALLGADLRLTSQEPFTADALAAIDDLEALGTSARVTRFGAMVQVETDGNTRLVDLRAFERDYPLYGELRTQPPSAVEGMRAGTAAVVDPALLIQLGAAPGDVLVIGEARFAIAGTIGRVPGGFGLSSSGNLAPRVVVSHDALEATGLLGVGSLVEYGVYLRSSDLTALTALAERHEERLLDEHVRVQTLARFEEQLSRGVAFLSDFLGLVGLAALLLAGVGVATGMHLFAHERLDSVAVLRCLGARPREIFVIYGLQAASLGFFASLLGVILGLVAQFGIPPLVEHFLPLDVPARIDPMVTVAALTLGTGASVLFALLPLLELRSVAPLRAFRRELDPARGAPDPLRIVGFAIVGIAVVLAALWQAPRVRDGLFFALGLAAAGALLAITARALRRGLRGALPASTPFWLRQGVANLFRPRNQTLAVTLALGLAVFLIASLQLVQYNLLDALAFEQSPDQPNLVLFDVQSDQREEALGLLAAAAGQVRDQAPIVSARLIQLRGRAVGELAAADSEREWGLTREYRLTYRDRPSKTERITAGSWWTEAREEGMLPRISFETTLARELGIEVGDVVGWDIQGVVVETRVTSLRRVDWEHLATNFFVVFEPGVLEEAPQMHVVVARVPDAEQRAELQRDLVARFPNISVIDASSLMLAASKLVGRTALAIRFMASFALASGVLVLLASVYASRARRERESALLGTLGANGSTLRRIAFTEYAALGTISAGTGLVLACLGSWALVHWVFELEFGIDPVPLLALWLATVFLTSAMGSGPRALRRRTPLAALREAD
jgi:putative ABC transport system permease protein